jgi:O-antigen ligase
MKYKNFLWSGFLLFVFTIPLSQFVSVRILLVLLVASFFLKGNENGLGMFFKNSWDILLYLSVLAFGLVYSTDRATGWGVIESNFSLLAVPLFLNRLFSLDRARVNQVLYAFKLGLLIAAGVCLGVAIYRYSIESDIRFFFFYEFTEAIKSHPTYYAYYVIFVISTELFDIYYGESSRQNPLKFLLILGLFLILILTGGQTAFIGILLVFLFFVLKFITDARASQKRIETAFVAVLLVCLFLISFVEKEVLAFRNFSDTWERAILWESAITAMPDLLFGVGTGDYKIALNDYFSTHGLPHFATENYNAHNQAIHTLFSNGFIGLAAMCTMTIRPLVLAIRNRNMMVVLCFFPFLIYGVTEAFLGRYQGIVFFGVLHQVFCLSLRADQPISTEL